MQEFSKIFNSTLGLFHGFFKEIKLLLQTNTRILDGQIDQLLLLPTLGLEDLGIYKGLDRFLIDILRDQDFIRDQVGFLLVKLPHIGQEILIWIIIVRKEIDVALDQFALTDKEDLHTHPALVHVVAKDIPVLQILGHDPLFGPQGPNSLDQIPILGCPLEFHVLRSGIHFELELIDDLIILPLEEIRNLLGHALEISLILVADCMSHALP